MCGSLVLPILDIWWRLPWVSKPSWIPSLDSQHDSQSPFYLLTFSSIFGAQPLYSVLQTGRQTILIVGALPHTKSWVDMVLFLTRMHSGRIHTIRSSSCMLGVSASVHAGIHTLIWTPRLGLGLETPPARPPNLPLDMGLETPWPDPSTSP